MTEEFPDTVARAFEDADAFERAADGYEITTSAFGGTVTVTETDEEWTHTYSLTVEVPDLDNATTDHVAEVVVTDWVETLERRLEDAPKSTRASVELTAFDIEHDQQTVTIDYEFEWGNPERAVDIAKTFAEFVEGTYVEGIIPGYEYDSPVSELLSSASQSGESGTPL